MPNMPWWMNMPQTMGAGAAVPSYVPPQQAPYPYPEMSMPAGPWWGEQGHTTLDPWLSGIFPRIPGWGEGTPLNFPAGRAPEAQGWLNTLLPWYQQAQLGGQFYSQMDFQRSQAMAQEQYNRWQQEAQLGYQGWETGQQLGWQREQQAGQLAFGREQEQRIRDIESMRAETERDVANISTFGRRRSPNPRWL